jgi:glutaredoxin
MTDTDILPQTSGIQALLHASKTPVTVFTLSWCSYCHAAKQLLDHLKIAYTTVELDTGEFANQARHEQLRRELLNITSSRTLPQVFVGTSHNIGGYTETRQAAQGGRLQELVKAQLATQNHN